MLRMPMFSIARRQLIDNFLYNKGLNEPWLTLTLCGQQWKNIAVRDKNWQILTVSREKKVYRKIFSGNGKKLTFSHKLAKFLPVGRKSHHPSESLYGTPQNIFLIIFRWLWIMLIDFSKRNRKAQANTFPLRHFRRKYIDTQVKNTHVHSLLLGSSQDGTEQSNICIQP